MVGSVPPLLAAIVESIAEGVLVVDADQRVRLANRRAVDLLGLPPAWRDAPLARVSPDYRVALTVTSCFDHGAPVERSLSDAQRGRDTLIRALPVVDGGRVVAVAVLLHDRTQLRRLETVRRDFTANLSHELRTPAAAIKLMVETLRAGALEDPEATREFVSRIGEEAEHMTRMIEQALELSAIESEQTVRNPAPIAPGDLLASLERLRPLADARGIAIDVDAEADLPPVLGEALRLEQVLRNVAHNALKFSPDGGAVTVSAAAVDGGSRVAIRVSDSGPGIPAEDLPRVFERFWKGDVSRRRDGEGTGLGLAIARHIAEAHGGSLVAWSEPGRGATFTLTLPAATDPRMLATSSSNRPRVLPRS